MIWGMPQADRTKLVRRYDSPRAHAARGSLLTPGPERLAEARACLFP